jgi:hypothetical protein
MEKTVKWLTHTLSIEQRRHAASRRTVHAQARLIEEAREIVTLFLSDDAHGFPNCPMPSPYRDKAKAFLTTLPAKTAESPPTREEMRSVLAAVANAHRLIRGDCPGAAGDVLRTIMQSTSAYQVPATERTDG